MIKLKISEMIKDIQLILIFCFYSMIISDRRIIICHLMYGKREKGKEKGQYNIFLVHTKTRTKVVFKNVSQACSKIRKSNSTKSRSLLIFLNSRKYRWKDGLFVRCRRTYVFNTCVNPTYSYC